MGAIVRKETCELPAELALKARRYAGASLAQVTRERYRHLFGVFTNWCDQHGRINVPATTETVALFLADIAERYSPATIKGLLTAIGHAHHAAGEPFDRTAFDLVLEGIRRRYGVPARQSLPITVGELRSLIVTLPDTLCGVRDRAILTMGFAGALRAAEVVGLDIGPRGPRSLGHAEIDGDGVRLALRRPQVGHAPIIKALPRGGNPCPVEALERWLSMAGIASGAIFRHIDSSGQLTDARADVGVVRRIIKRAVVARELQAGVTQEAARAHARRFTSQSLRAGFVTSAVLAGASSESIARHVGWLSTFMVAQYQRKGGVFKKHPVQRVLCS